MANYQETTASGTSWVRSNSVNIQNPLNGTPSVTFNTETVIQLEGGATIVQPNMRWINKVFNSTEEFPIINPETNEPTGTFSTHSELYALLYSLFIKTVTDLDTQSMSQPAPIEVPSDLPLPPNPTTTTTEAPTITTKAPRTTTTTVSP